MFRTWAAWVKLADETNAVASSTTTHLAWRLDRCLSLELFRRGRNPVDGERPTADVVVIWVGTMDVQADHNCIIVTLDNGADQAPMPGLDLGTVLDSDPVTHLEIGHGLGQSRRLDRLPTSP